MSDMLGSVPIVGGLLKTELHHQLQRRRPEIEKWAMGLAFKALGLPDLTDTNLTRESFTQALNAGPLAGTGLQLTNIFDKRAIQLDFQRLALTNTMGALGVQTTRAGGIDSLREALRDWVSGEVRKQLEDGAADDLIKGAKESMEVIAILRAVSKEFKDAQAAGLPPPTGAPPKKPLLTSKEAVQNRERQARFRASHKKHWELK